METTVNVASMDGFHRSLKELLDFADCLKLREKELEEQHRLDREKQQTEYDLQIQIEKRRNEQLQTINRTLTEQLERGTQKQVELEQKNSVLETKYKCSLEECKQIKEQLQEKQRRIDELEKIARILTNDKSKLDNEIKQLKTENQNLQEKINQTPVPSIPPAPQSVPDDFLKLVEKAVAENQELKTLLTDRDAQIQKLTEQLNKAQTEDSQLIEQRLLQQISKLKSDFRTMYQDQFDFFIRKIDLLKQEQRENIASLYKH